MERKLKDVCDFYAGTGFPVKYQGKDNGELPFYKVGDIANNVNARYLYLTLCNHYISKEEAKELKGKIVPSKTVVFAKIGEALKLNRRAITSQDCLIDNNVMGIAPRENELNLSYFFYYMKNLKMELLSESTTVPSVRKSMLEDAMIKVPSIDVQAEIGKILDGANEIIQLRKQQIDEFDTLIKSRFIEMFGNKNKKIPVKSLCDISGGYSFKSGDITSDGDVKILQIGNVYLNDVNWETTNYLPKGYDVTYSKYSLNEGDIVVALTRPIIQSFGNVKACIIKASDMPCLLNQRVGRIVPKSNTEVSLKFIYGCLLTDDFTRYVEACLIGCSQPNISTKDIENYLIPDVGFEEQLEFGNFKDQVDKLKLSIQQSLDETQKLFDSLMQEYFG